MINKAICINGLVNHLLCLMQCHLNGVHISEVPKFLAENLSKNTYAIELADLFDTAHLLIILLQLSRVTSYFDVLSPSVTGYENDDIPKIYLTAEEPPWDLSTSENSEREIHMFEHQGQLSIPATAAR